MPLKMPPPPTALLQYIEHEKNWMQLKVAHYNIQLCRTCIIWRKIKVAGKLELTCTYLGSFAAEASWAQLLKSTKKPADSQLASRINFDICPAGALDFWFIKYVHKSCMCRMPAVAMLAQVRVVGPNPSIYREGF